MLVTSFLFNERNKVYIRLPPCNKNLVKLNKSKAFSITQSTKGTVLAVTATLVSLRNVQVRFAECTDSRSDSEAARHLGVNPSHSYG